MQKAIYAPVKLRYAPKTVSTEYTPRTDPVDELTTSPHRLVLGRPPILESKRKFWLRPMAPPEIFIWGL